jgi:hypothetical protein
MNTDPQHVWEYRGRVYVYWCLRCKERHYIAEELADRVGLRAAEACLPSGPCITPAATTRGGPP